MLKLKKLIKEHTWDREFGEPLPTFKGVMKQHQINKLEEGWWDNMSDEAQAAYIKKYGEAPDANGDDEPKVPAPDSRSDTGKPRVSANPYDDNYGQEVDDEDVYDMGEVPGSRGTGPWTPEDDPDFEHGPSLTSAPGRVPDEDEYPDKDPINTKKGEMEDEMEDIANELDNVTDPDEKKELEDRYDKIDQELYDINKKQYGDDSGYEKSGRTGKELDQETLTIDGKQYKRITEGKINSKFIKYRIYDKISDEINKVEPDDFNLRDFNPLKRKLVQFVQREVKRDRKMGSLSVLKQAFKRSDFEDKVFGRRGIIDGWYKKSERDFPKFLKRNPNLKWKNYNASSLTYGIGKPLYKIVDSLLDGINSLVPESKYAFSEFYERFKK